MAWNTEEEDGRMVRLVNTPRKAVLQIVGLGSTDVSRSVQFPATPRELLQKLQVRVVVFHDRIDINVIFTIEPIYHQKCTSSYQREGD